MTMDTEFWSIAFGRAGCQKRKPILTSGSRKLLQARGCVSGSNPAWTELKELVAEHDKTTLLYGARDTADNEAVALAEFLNTD